MTRSQQSLSGTWQFQTDPAGTVAVVTLAPGHTIKVPLPWQAAFPELEHYTGYAWYRTGIDLNDQWLGGELLLKFGAVDYWCQVFVNGLLVGEHEGGYTPFTLRIGAQARAGRNEIAVRVYDSAQQNITIPRWHEDLNYQDSHQPPFDPRNVPHGKQEWYLNCGGIWQDVKLIAVPHVYIENVRITPDIHTGRVDVSVELGGDPARIAQVNSGTLSLAIDGATAAVSLDGRSDYTLSVTVPTPRLWSTDSPQLYTAAVQLNGNGIDDSLSTRFGFREITTRNGQLLLNGEPLYLLAALDQDMYADTIYTVPSESYLRDEFKKARELGLNCLRCHIKPPDPLYLDLADEMGLLVWEEIPSWRTFFPKTTIHPQALELSTTIQERVRQTLAEMVRRDFNHPSLIIWTIVNEDWGTALPLRADDRAWVTSMYDLCKQLDPTRLVVDNSACGGPWGPNIHVKSDLDDFHIYTGIPDHADSWTQTLEQFDLRPLWTYSSHGDAQRTGQEPLILSEFGNWGLPSVRALAGPDGQPPAWFKLGPWWSSWDGEPGWPNGVLERFKKYGLDNIWPDYEAFATASQWHQFAALKFEIETMRRQAAVMGYVITELSDIYWESNGLLDFYRCPKAYHAEFASINALDIIVPQVDSYAWWDDQPALVRLHGAHFSAEEWSGGKLAWSIDGVQGAQGTYDLPAVPRGSVTQFGVERWTLPRNDQTRFVQARLSLKNGSGVKLAHNTVDLLVLPSSARQTTYQGEVAVLSRSTTRLFTDSEATAVSSSEPHADGFESALQRLGYRTSQHVGANTRLIVTDYPTAEALQWVRDGGDMLYLSSGPGPFFWRQGRGGAYNGSWMSSFSWLRPGVYRRLNVPSPLTLPFMHIMPTGVIVGVPLEDHAVQGDFLAGQITGWLQHPALHTVQFRYGKGRVIMTVYALRDALQALDPVGVAMFHDLIDHLTSDACQPTLAANY